MAVIQGKVRKFGDNIDTDSITTAAVLHLPINEIAEHAFEAIFPGFYHTVNQGDIIVAGANFGCGSSREHATAVVKELGIHFIVCESMARIYFRNCIALGVHPILAKGVSELFNECDPIEIDLYREKVRNVRTGSLCSFRALSGTPKQILEDGGILPTLKKVTEKLLNQT